MAAISQHNAILVGVDGSSCARSAVQWAAREAATHHLPLTVVYGAYPAIGEWSGWGLSPAPLPEDFGELQQAEARGIIDDALDIVTASVGADRLRVTSEILWSPVVPTLVDLSKEARMIVVGCRGQGALARSLLGSVSSALVHHAHCPVAVIHDEGIQAAGSETRPVLVGIDGSPASETATAIAFGEASWRGVDLVALHAWSDADWPDDADVDWSAIKASAGATLAERVAGWRQRYPDVAVEQVVVFDHPARHLIDRSASAQLVVVGSHGRGGFAGMLLGSVSTDVVHGARVPVIVARPT